jgi:sugar lactone lactonase YvrE
MRNTQKTIIFLVILCLLCSGVSRPVSARTRAAHQSLLPNLLNGAIQGVVKDANGNPISGIGVGAGDFATLLGCGPANYWTATDASGNYTLNVPQGNYMVFVNSHSRSEGYLPEAYASVNSWAKINSATAVRVNAGQMVAGINFNLPIGYKLSGRLVDIASQPVLGAGGHLQDPIQQIEYGCALGNSSSNSDGAFEFNVPAGLYDLGFCKDSECHTVVKGKIIRANTALGDVLFSEAGRPASVFDPQAVLPGYDIETVVAGGPNTPSDVTVTPNGKIYLAAVRSWRIYEVSQTGNLSELAGLGVYSLQAGSNGNLYGYFMPDSPKGKVYKITPGGTVSETGSVPTTNCESTLAVGPAPNLDLWIGWNGCGGASMTGSALFRMTQGGAVYTVTTGGGYINGLDFDASGRLFMTYGNQLFQVNTSNGSLTLLATIPDWPSFHGLVAAQDGSKYISTSSQNPSIDHYDRIYKVTSTGTVSVLAELPAGCLQGLAQEPDGDLLGTMRCTGALYRIHLDGQWETLLPGNGMATPQAMAFNLAGELLVNNDESGRIIKVQDGRGQFFYAGISYIPPFAFMAFLPSGDFYYSEAAPGFTPHLSRISPGGKATEVTEALGWPSGLAFSLTGQLFAAENMTGTISMVSPSGERTPFVFGLTRPQPLAADSNGNLYVGDYSGTLQDPTNAAENPGTDRIWKVDASGVKTRLLDHVAQMIAVSPTGELFLSGQVGEYYYGVLRVNADQSLTPIAIGLLNPVGLAFDVAGNLYVSDDQENGIVRITGFRHGYLAGTISNAQGGAVIPQAVVTLVTGYPLIKGLRINADVSGNYIIPAEGRQYTLTVSAIGFCPNSQSVSLSAGRTKTINVALQPCPTLFLPLVRTP